MAGDLDSGRAGREALLARRRRLVGLINGHEISAAIGAVARLGIPDALARGPLSAGEIATRVDADPGSVERVLRSLVSVDLFERLEDGRFALTDTGELLRAGVADSVRMAAIVSSDEWLWRPYGYFTHSLRTGQPGFLAAHGQGFWGYLETHPEDAATFNAHMSQSVALRARAFAQAYDFSGLERLVDVGGGHGALVQAVLGAHPHMRAAIFDLPGVVDGARERIAAAGLTDRCELVAGDFFQDPLPAGGDAYAFSWILHDWDDEPAVQILAGCRRAIAPGGRLLVIELVVPAGDQPNPAASIDLTMLVVVGGRERTEAEYRALYARAGFELTQVIPLDDVPWSVIEGRPV
jgi:ubiquinone/menaquinone biosynthesis C-methylase UbiE